MVHIEKNDNAPVDLEAMHDIADVVMGSIHKSFDGKTLDAATLGFTLVLIGLGTLKDAKFDHVKERVKDFIDAIDLNEIRPFDPHQSS